MRYFFYSAVFVRDGYVFGNYSTRTHDFPSMDALEAKVVKQSGGKDVVILSITELSEENYYKLFPDEN